MTLAKLIELSPKLIFPLDVALPYIGYRNRLGISNLKASPINASNNMK